MSAEKDVVKSCLFVSTLVTKGSCLSTLLIKDPSE